MSDHPTTPPSPAASVQQADQPLCNDVQHTSGCSGRREADNGTDTATHVWSQVPDCDPFIAGHPLWHTSREPTTERPGNVAPLHSDLHHSQELHGTKPLPDPPAACHDTPLADAAEDNVPSSTEPRILQARLAEGDYQAAITTLRLARIERDRDEPDKPSLAQLLKSKRK